MSALLAPWGREQEPGRSVHPSTAYPSTAHPSTALRGLGQQQQASLGGFLLSYGSP